jgi:hypothetical protein
VIAGIDEPIVVEGITVQGLMGATTTGDLTLLLLAAYTEESLEDREGKAIYPENSSDVYLTLMLKWEGPSGSLNWLVRNGRLESGGQVYPVERAGDEYAAGIWKGSFLICPIPRESEYGSYRLELPDGQGIDLSPFFGDPGQPTALRTPTPAPPTATPTPVTPTRRVPIHTPTPTPLPTATRDVSTLDKALLGHWVTESGVTDFYFSPGTLIQDEPSGTMHLTWTMLEQNETENWMRIQVQRPDTGGGHEKMLRFASDRKSLVAETTIAQKWLYVDNKQKP